MFKRRPATPQELHDQLVDAQVAHAEAVSAANARLAEQHASITSDASNRAAMLSEQITLLTVERDELAAVADTPEPYVGSTADEDRQLVG
jgi:hypothetical protein